MSDRRLLQPGFGVFLVICWLAIVAQLLATEWNTVLRTLGDADDALRLEQVRTFLAGRGWFDLYEPRMGWPLGYHSHWSRLIDAGLSGLFVVFRAFADTPHAELLMRVVWPLLWLLPTIAAAAAIAWRLAGRTAATTLLLMAALALPAFQQFSPGRIDHHNVQIALAVATLAAAAWSDRHRGAAAAAGALTGLALAIGLEGFPFSVVAGAALALRYCDNRAAATNLRDYGLALSASTLVGFLVSVGPDHWGVTACDAIAVNWTAPGVAAGVLLALSGGFVTSERALIRCAAIAGVVVVAAAVFIAADPHCLGGPFVMTDPTVRQIWEAHNGEMQPLARLLREKPAIGIPLLAYPAVVLIVSAVLAGLTDMRRDAGFLVTAAAATMALATMFAAAKTFNYAVWIGMPLVAAGAVRLSIRLQLGMLARVGVAVLLAPLTLSFVAILAAPTNDAGLAEVRDLRESKCYDSSSYQQLATLPKGVVAADIRSGPFILALTPHTTVSGPYHRLSPGILAAYRVFASPPDEARRIVADHTIDYLVLCGRSPPSPLRLPGSGSNLWSRMTAGELPDWLEKLPARAGEVFTVYRVRRD